MDKFFFGTFTISINIFGHMCVWMVRGPESAADSCAEPIFPDWPKNAIVSTEQNYHLRHLFTYTFE